MDLPNGFTQHLGSDSNRLELTLLVKMASLALQYHPSTTVIYHFSNFVAFLFLSSLPCCPAMNALTIEPANRQRLIQSDVRSLLEKLYKTYRKDNDIQTELSFLAEVIYRTCRGWEQGRGNACSLSFYLLVVVVVVID